MEDNSLRILIADDDVEITELLNAFFSSQNYKCDIVNNGRDALIKVKENVYDVVILDVMMPYIDGYHVAYEITNSFELDKQPVVIILTSRDVEFEKPIAKMSGAYEIVQKPFELDKLMEVIRNSIKNRSQ